MDAHRPGYSLMAPARSGAGAALRLPGRGDFPGVDDHLVVPEVTRDEILGGRRIVALPAHPPHATQQTRLDYVLGAHVAPGFTAATDLLTRHDEESDFASDACVFREGVDPATGGRYLEEIAFEVVSEQNEGYVSEKAVRMHRSGVRRIFTVWVKSRRVCEWSAASQSWRPLPAGARIEDSCLVSPLAVEALLDAAAADKAVVEALVAKGDPTIRQREEAAKAEGRAAGVAEAVLQVLAARGLDVSPERRQEVLRCQDLERLHRWLRRAALVSSAAEVISEP